MYNQLCTVPVRGIRSPAKGRMHAGNLHAGNPKSIGLCAHTQLNQWRLQAGPPLQFHFPFYAHTVWVEKVWTRQQYFPSVVTKNIAQSGQYNTYQTGYLYFLFCTLGCCFVFLSLLISTANNDPWRNSLNFNMSSFAKSNLQYVSYTVLSWEEAKCFGTDSELAT